MSARLALAAIVILAGVQVLFMPAAGVARTDREPPPNRTSVDRDAKTEKRSQRAQRKDAKADKKDGAKADKGRKAKRDRGERRDRVSRRSSLRDAQSRRAGPIRIETGVIRGAEQEALRAENRGRRYIVVFKDDGVNSQAAVNNLADASGVIPTIIYEHVFSGFAAYLTPEAKRRLDQDARVAAIVEDQENELWAQTVPKATERVDADQNPTADIDGTDERVDADIAIIDTGVQLDHPDLNVFAYANCTPSPDHLNQFDPDGHGTHVAGTAAALDNNIGTVGVAPGARIWAMRTQDDNGFIFDSYIIECLDIVAFHAKRPLDGQTIDAVNVSLGREGDDGPCNSEPIHLAYCKAVNAGATIAVSAGNDADDAHNYIPSTFQELITVSALADIDGQSGGQGGTFDPVCYSIQNDDTIATFSNFGADVDIAAPGIDVLSTWPTYFTPPCPHAASNGYSFLQGTSMASPHVAGAAALLKAGRPNLTLAQVKAELLAIRENAAMPGDPDGINEGILNVGFDDPNGPDLTVNAPRTATVKKKITIRVSATDFWGIDRVVLNVCTAQCQEVATDTSRPFAFVRRHNKAGSVRYMVQAIDDDGNVTEQTKTIRITKEQKKKKRR